MNALCQRCAPRPNDQRTAKAQRVWSTGMSAVELMVVLVIVGVLTKLAIPSFQFLIQGNRISSEISALMNDLQYARAEAMRTGQFVSICISSDGASCNVSSGDWRNGWIIFSDPNGNRTVNNGDTLLRIRKAFSNTDTLQSNPVTSSMAFNRNGFATGLNANVLMLAKTTPINSQLTRCLSINVVGRMQVQTPTSNPTTCR